MGYPPEFTGMYLNLLMAAWENGGHLPDDERQLQRITGGSFDQWLEYRQDLANLFVPRNGVWSHNLVRKELKKAEVVSEKAKIKSKKGNDARWAKTRAMKKADDLIEKIKADGCAY